MFMSPHRQHRHAMQHIFTRLQCPAMWCAMPMSVLVVRTDAKTKSPWGARRPPPPTVRSATMNYSDYVTEFIDKESHPRSWRGSSETVLKVRTGKWRPAAAAVPRASGGRDNARQS